VLESHVREHVVQGPARARAEATRELLDAMRTYIR